MRAGSIGSNAAGARNGSAGTPRPTNPQPRNIATESRPRLRDVDTSFCVKFTPMDLTRFDFPIETNGENQGARRSNSPPIHSRFLGLPEPLPVTVPSVPASFPLSGVPFSRCRATPAISDPPFPAFPEPFPMSETALPMFPAPSPMSETALPMCREIFPCRKRRIPCVGRRFPCRKRGFPCVGWRFPCRKCRFRHGIYGFRHHFRRHRYCPNPAPQRRNLFKPRDLQSKPVPRSLRSPIPTQPC